MVDNYGRNFWIRWWHHEVFIKGIGYLYYQHFMVDLLPSDCDDWCFYYRSILYDGEGCQREIGTLHKEFFRSFRMNFKDSIVINLIYLFLMIISGHLIFI